MGIQIEFNPDLALRSFEEAVRGRRKPEECLPRILDEGCIYEFLKKGQRNYWLEGEIPLLITQGNQKLSRPVASIQILEATHFMRYRTLYTKGKYLVKEVFNEKDPTIHFEGLKRI